MNSNIERRIKKAEQKLNMGQEEIVFEVTYYGSGPLPSDVRRVNILTHFVRFEPAQAENMNKQSNGLQEQTAP